MFRLSREVRFAINDPPDDQLLGKPTNSYAGFPSLTGWGRFYALRITLAGAPESSSQYLCNIKQIDGIIRQVAIPYIAGRVSADPSHAPFGLPVGLMDLLRDSWPGSKLEQISLQLSPFLCVSTLASEHPMVRLSQKFEFSATHRLHNPALSDADNRETFGKCNNPQGHGHNYEVQVTLIGRPNESGLLIDVPRFERIVADTVIDRFDHKNLNVELPEFRTLIPTVENIAMTIFRLLKPHFAAEPATLSSVTVWETPKTWCEYAEEA